MSMLKKAKGKINEYIFYPQVLSLQTLGQALLLCNDLYSYTNDQSWEKEAKNVVYILISFQNPDGGFGIGYDWFGAGKKHSKYASTSPELEELYAVIEYAIIFKDKDVDKSIERGISWIRSHSYKIDEDVFVIPYDPTASKEVFINNSVSFAVKCLAAYSTIKKLDKELIEIYVGLINFLEDELEKDEKYEGKFWRYFHQDSKDAPKTKWGAIIENHHIGMQLAYHCTAQKNVPLSENLEIIKEVAKYLKSVQRKNGLIPYSSNINTNIVDVWGFAPCAMGFVESYDILKDKDYLKCAKKVIDWIVEYSWNGNYFIPVLDEEGNIKDDNYYPRSDAWIVHSIAHYMRCTGYDEELYRICEEAYLKIKKDNFRGKEKFAWNIRKEILLKTVNLIKTGKWRY